MITFFLQELYARSLDSVEDNSLTVDLLELKTFYSASQVLNTREKVVWENHQLF